MSGIGGTIVDRPMVRKEKDELAGKFRFGKTILITDLKYRCQSNSRGTTNIQYGLDEMGYVVTVIDINSFKSVTRAQKFLDAVEHLIKGVMPEHCGRGECDHPLLDIICIPHHRHSSI